MKDGIDQWESNLYLTQNRRLCFAWINAGFGYFLAGVLGIALMGLTPFKTIKPIVVVMDKQTGTANVSSMLGTITLDDEEALTQSLLFRYVRDRETYNNMDQPARINEVHKVTQDRARTDLEALYANDNPLNPVTVHGSDRRINVKIKSVVLQPDNQALIRLEKSSIETPGARPIKRAYVVSIHFGFDREGAMPLEERWDNPVGFYVDDYRIDQEAG
ncbi:virB8 family protein [Pelagibius sp. Alg239-R121]|uniref:virB8 family protein n=1 Tax=Pelagibius sp. Alg239-R121 TaxID=2993448 RepID=UPI0024A68373|nr:type IV secretion system protein [Pelagibius sp. Alg239-R121]